MANSGNSPPTLPSPPSRYGLEDCGIVQIVEDRGEQHFRSDIGIKSEADDATESQTFCLEDLPNKLMDVWAKAFYHEDGFIPRRMLYDIMSVPQVARIIKELGCSEDHDGLARRICLGTQKDSTETKPPCRKLLASLVGMKRADLIKCAMDDNMCDDCLPLQSKLGDRTKFVNCQVEKHNHAKFNEQLTDWTERRNLIEYSYRLTGVYLKQLEDKHFHYVLDSADHLPMQTHGQVLENLHTKEVTVSKDAPTDTGQYQNLGGFGQVFKVEIDPCHYKFVSKVDAGNGGAEESPRKWFALKKLNDPRASVFEEELKSLLYCLHHKFDDEKLLDEGQKHMAHVRASFEIRNKSTPTTNYYFIFDWQEGNLSQFWEKENHLREKEDYPKCMAEQMFGLAAALQLVHNDRTAHMRPHQNQNHSLYGRHGDLSPSNILYSTTKDGKIVLKLADFGLAQLHSRMSRTFGNSKRPDRTETYKGPEFDIKGGKISRATDMFSFGCVLLEHITWYLLGPRAVTEFSDARFGPEPHKASFKTDVYWTLPSTTSRTDDVTLKPQVHEHIERLKADRRCSWFLFQMLDLIKTHMLDPKPENRITSSQLTKRLDMFRKTCQVEPDYYTKFWRSTELELGPRAPLTPRRGNSHPVGWTLFRPPKRVGTIPPAHFPAWMLAETSLVHPSVQQELTVR